MAKWQIQVTSEYEMSKWQVQVTSPPHVMLSSDYS